MIWLYPTTSLIHSAEQLHGISNDLLNITSKEYAKLSNTNTKVVSKMANHTATTNPIIVGNYCKHYVCRLHGFIVPTAGFYYNK
jgi:hypothetical protein